MIKSLYTIGKVLKDKYPEYFEPWINPFPNQEAKVIVAMVKNGKLEGELEEEVFRPAFISKYLYRELSGTRGTFLLPTLKLYIPKKRSSNDFKKDIDRLKRTLTNKLFEYYIINISEFGTQIISNLHSFNFNPDFGYLFTIKFNDKYIGEIEDFKNLLIENAYSKYFQTKKFISKGKNKVCSVTYQESGEVWGKVDTLGFTVDEQVFVRNGFEQNQSYKMFPVSPNAVTILEGAKNLLFEKCSNNFYGMKYLILPHIINGKDKVVQEAMEEFLNKSTLPLSHDRSKSIIDKEDILKEIIDDAKLSHTNIYYDLLFYRQNKKQLVLKNHLSDILPSRLRKVFNVKHSIENKFKDLNNIIFRKSRNNIEVKEFFITFLVVKDYFSKKVKTDTIFHPMFFKILEAVFYGNYLDESVILKAFHITVVSHFKNRNENKYAFSQSVKESFALYQFLYQLNLFKYKKYMETQNTNTVALDVDGFINQHSNFFDSEYKKGIFMLGVLTNKLLAKQKNKLKSEPFLKNLNNLNLDESEIKKMFPKLLNKIREYDISHYTKELEGKVAQRLVQKQTVSKTDISYIFTLGLVMGNEFDREFFRKLKEDEENQ